MILWVLLGFAVLLLLIDRKEHMTNEDLLSTLKTFGDAAPKKKKNPAETDKTPILGPRSPAVVPADSGKTKLAPTVSGVYPDIYGPEITATPGTKPGTKPNAKHESDNVDDKTYEFNPDLQKAFPTEGPPQPFLTDFSKIH
jgi:hypothetical protein